jgi:enoyl-CoA hydratase/carnithine racemase
MDGTETVRAWRDGRAGRILLTRPKALNALDLPMIQAIAAAAARFRADPAIHLVTIAGDGGRAFCAGGDVRAVRQAALDGQSEPIEAFFRSEYALNRAIAEYNKPWVALIDGICMGGGIGLSVHGRARVVTEHAMLAMPETAIALFPDVGATYALPRLPGELGMYLALTGARMLGADAVHAGLATHYVPREDLPALDAALAQDGEAALAKHAAPLPPFSLAPHRAAIDRCFGAPSVAAIVARLEAEGSDWAAETLKTLRGMSPSSLCWSYAILRAGAARALPEALEAELRLTRGVTKHPDFHEGVRAMVVDKDRAPRWHPATLEAVDPAVIEALLA